METRIKVIIVCICTIAGLVIFYIVLDSLFFGATVGKVYWINLGGNLTYERDNLTLVIGTSQNTDSRSLSIYGLDSESNWRIFSSFLSSESEKDLSSNNIRFNNNLTYSFSVTNLPTIIDVTVQNLERGIYHGWWYINGISNFSIPITLLTEPKVVQAIILVIIGVLLSIAIWEIFFILYVRANRDSANSADNKKNQIIQHYTIQNVLAPPSEQERIDYLEQKKRIRKKKADGTDKRYLEDAGKIFTMDIATIGFGILTGIIGLLNNNYVTTIVQIDIMDAAVLIGIGLGIGSLKGLVDKPKSD